MTQTFELHPILSQDDVRGVVFDLDGTLIDSAADIIQGMRLTFAQAGFGTLPNDYFPDNLHGTSEGIMRSIVSDMGWPMPVDFRMLRALYVENYSVLDHRRTHLYDGAAAMLQACRDAGLPLGICTNKVHASALKATEKVGIQPLFDVISGADTWSAAKPSPIPLLETIRMLGLEPAQCLYFGDTSVDAACAQQAGVRFVLHESGYGDPVLQQFPRYFAFGNWNELLVAQPMIA